MRTSVDVDIGGGGGGGPFGSCISHVKHATSFVVVVIVDADAVVALLLVSTEKIRAVPSLAEVSTCDPRGWKVIEHTAFSCP